MMPQCYYKRCTAVGLHKIDLHIEWHHPYVCDKHLRKIAKLLHADVEELKKRLRKDNG